MDTKMKFRFKYLVTGTWLCLSCSLPCAALDSAFGLQSDHPQLQTLLQPQSATSSPGFLTVPSREAEAGPLVRPVQFQQLVPQETGQMPAPPAATENQSGRPLVPVHSAKTSDATPLPAPIVKRPPVPVIKMSTGQPAMSNPQVGQTLPGIVKSATVPNGLPNPTSQPGQIGVPIVSGSDGRSAPAWPPQPAPPATSTPASPTSNSGGQDAAAASAGKSELTSKLESNVQAPPAARASADPRASGPVAATTPGITRDAADDGIEIVEMTEESVAQLMQAFGIGAAAPSTEGSSAPPEPSRFRANPVGSSVNRPVREIGMESGELLVEPFHQSSMGMGDLGYYGDPGYGTDGLNFGHRRPLMPDRLPYDGYGTISGASSYTIVDFLYMGREGGDYTVSFAPFQGDYDYSPGLRARFGRRWDSIEGWELGFTLMETHTSSNQVFSPNNTLISWLSPGPGFNAASLSSFNGAAFHESFHKGHYYAAEWNRMNWNWDVMSTFIGLRYTGIDDMFGLHTLGGDGSLGAYRLRARNHMVGPQMGGSLHYDIGRKLSFSLAAKAGGYVNFFQTDTEFANNNIRLLDNKSSRRGLAWGTELGFFTHYSLSPRARIKGGWELWFYDGLATSRDQLDGFISPFSGLRANNRDHVLFHGFSVGLEWYR